MTFSNFVTVLISWQQMVHMKCLLSRKNHESYHKIYPLTAFVIGALKAKQKSSNEQLGLKR